MSCFLDLVAEVPQKVVLSLDGKGLLVGLNDHRFTYADQRHPIEMAYASVLRDDVTQTPDPPPAYQQRAQSVAFTALLVETMAGGAYST
jgi:hypothetical protein